MTLSLLPDIRLELELLTVETVARAEALARRYHANTIQEICMVLSQQTRWRSSMAQVSKEITRWGLPPPFAGVAGGSQLSSRLKDWRKLVDIREWRSFGQHEKRSLKGGATVVVLLMAVLAVLGVCVLLAYSVRSSGRVQLGMSDGTSVVSVDSGLAPAESGLTTMTLHDNEWGLSGRLDLILEEPDGLVPVEWKRADVAPLVLRPSHQLQMGVYLLLCEADTQVGKRPAHGEVQYLDHQGRILLDGRFKVLNTEGLRQQVIETVRAMRNALRGGEVHRNHEISAKCHKCSVRAVCGEGFA